MVDAALLVDNGDGVHNESRDVIDAFLYGAQAFAAFLMTVERFGVFVIPVLSFFDFHPAPMHDASGDLRFWERVVT